MPGVRCTVGVCTNSRIKAIKSGNNKIRFFSFPKDKKIREIWVQRCERGGKWNPNNCRVCSEHFTEDDFERDLQAELLNLPRKRKLKTTAVPTLNLGKVYPPIATRQKYQRSKQSMKRSSKSLVLDIRESQETDNIDSVGTSIVTSREEPSSSQRNQIEYDILLYQYRTLLTENNEVKKQLIDMKKENDSLKAKISTLEKDLKFIATIKVEEPYLLKIEE